MDRHNQPRLDGTGPNNHALWFLVLLGLLCWQSWMTLTLFAPSQPWEMDEEGSPRPGQLLNTQALECFWRRLSDDRPILTGRHPFHLYFGYLGAQSLGERGTLCCYDSAFQIGYLKTPVFDSGSRPAELFLFLAGGKYQPGTYKIGLAACSLAVPLFLAVAAWGLGLGRGLSCLAVTLGLLVWWSTPGREALADGDLDLLLASLAGLAYVCLLVRFDRAPGAFSGLGLLACACLGWFTHPCFALMLVPLVLIYYLSVGVKHQLGWHLALLGTQAGALAVNSFWLADWVKYWWMRVPIQLGAEPMRQRTLQALWNAPLWGDPADRALAAGLFGAAVLGVVFYNQTKQRPAARLLGLGAGGFLALAVVGIAWPPLGRLGTAQLLLPALWFAVMPAVYALTQVVHWTGRWTGSPIRGALLCALPLVAGAYYGQTFLGAWAERSTRAEPLVIGLGPERAELVEVLKSNTGPDARILWEDRAGKRAVPRWSALLPILTERSYVGGLDPDASIEHAYASLIEATLAGRPIADWSDAELEDYCRRYNIGWAVCWSPAAVERFRAWKSAEPAVAVADEDAGQLFSIRQPRSFVLKGQARWLGASRRRISLADVVPENGTIVLSLHHQAGLQASPGRVQIEREPDPFDPIPFIRLRVPEPVARVTLTWEER